MRLTVVPIEYRRESEYRVIALTNEDLARSDLSPRKSDCLRVSKNRFTVTRIRQGRPSLQGLEGFAFLGSCLSNHHLHPLDGTRRVTSASRRGTRVARSLSRLARRNHVEVIHADLQRLSSAALHRRSHDSADECERARTGARPESDRESVVGGQPLHGRVRADDGRHYRGADTAADRPGDGVGADRLTGLRRGHAFDDRVRGGGESQADSRTGEDADAEVEPAEEEVEEDVLEDASDLEDDADAISGDIEVEPETDEKEL